MKSFTVETKSLHSQNYRVVLLNLIHGLTHIRDVAPNWINLFMYQIEGIRFSNEKFNA